MINFRAMTYNFVCTSKMLFKFWNAYRFTTRIYWKCSILKSICINPFFYWWHTTLGIIIPLTLHLFLANASYYVKKILLHHPANDLNPPFFNFSLNEDWNHPFYFKNKMGDKTLPWNKPWDDKCTLLFCEFLIRIWYQLCK